jgi:DNA recombination protein RmuC
MSVTAAIIISLGAVVLVLTAVILILLRRQTRSSTPGILDQQFTSMNLELGKVSDLVRELEKDREGKFGELSAQLKTAAQQTAALSTTTGALREALANSRARGQWGERMAEDVLQLIGFIEGVNYVKQKSLDESQIRPDFTFFLPRDFKLNMDVKFPLDNYLRSVNAASDHEESRYRAAFLRDVRGRLNEVAGKEYIDARQNTLGCVLLFIPNEQVYQFIQQHDSTLIDESLKKQVVLCSPMSLFAILVVIRQAVDNFTVERTSNQIIAELGRFSQQWEQFLKKLDDVGKRIDASQREYQTLITTRRRALERPLNRIEDLRRHRGISLPETEADTTGPFESPFEPRDRLSSQQ